MLDTVDVATPPPASVPVQPEPIVEAPVRWSVATRVAFRFCFIYFTLYALTTQMLGGFWIIPKLQPPDMGATGWMLRPIDWTASHVFHVSSQYIRVNTGSGDKMIDWLHAFLLLVFSIAATAIWSGLDRRRPNYVSMHKWFHVMLRFAAGTTMVGYGMAKAIPLQMPAPNLTRLLEPFGNFSPMGVLWYSIGASFPYERFAGAMELTAAVLLFIPRLSMLGAMVLVADSVQIFTLNMTYDVPVKLFSFHLIVMGLVLLAPDMRRLTDMLVLNRATGPSTLPPLARSVTVRRVLIAAQLVFGAYVVGTSFVDARASFFSRGAGAPKPPLYGIWSVEKMTVDGVERAPLVTDWGRWRRVVVQNAATIAFWRMDDSFVAYPSKVDMTAKSIGLTNTADKNWKAGFTFQQPAPDVLVLDGEMDGHKVRLDTRLFDRNRFLLVSRGFNWIQERPFNR
jgi:hypothetical protein